MLNTVHKTVNFVMVVALIFLLAISFAVIALNLGQSNTGNNAYPKEYQYRTVKVVIEDGDTLWGLATKHVPEMDPRHTVWAIREVNELASTVVHPGQVLEIPTIYSPASVQLATVSQVHN